MIVPSFQPLTLGRAPAPFSHPDYLFEIKFDGFRSLVRIEQGKGRYLRAALFMMGEIYRG